MRQDSRGDATGCDGQAFKVANYPFTANSFSSSYPYVHTAWILAWLFTNPLSQRAIRQSTFQRQWKMNVGVSVGTFYDNLPTVRQSISVPTWDRYINPQLQPPQAGDKEDRSVGRLILWMWSHSATCERPPTRFQLEASLLLSSQHLSAFSSR